MKKYDRRFLALVEELKKHHYVEGIMLAGSRVTENFDNDSDYDLYIYSYQEIPLDFRKQLSEQYFAYYELDNRTWEQEDQGFFKETNIQIDIVYRNIDWIKSNLDSVINRCQASTGYTTCLWANFINSDLLYDKNEVMKNLLREFNVEYPTKLQRNIIDKNAPLLSQIIPAYINQIEKAKKRKDYLSINHRVSAFFESYFDILFAINKVPHPGEKKMLKIALDRCKILPDSFEKDINRLMTNLFNDNQNIVEILNKITEEIDKVIKGNIK